MPTLDEHDKLRYIIYCHGVRYIKPCSLQWSICPPRSSVSAGTSPLNCYKKLRYREEDSASVVLSW